MIFFRKYMNESFTFPDFLEYGFYNHQESIIYYFYNLKDPLTTYM